MPNIGNILRDLKTKLPHEEMEISVRVNSIRAVLFASVGNRLGKSRA